MISTADQKQGWPLLGDLPVVGWFFRSSSKSESRREIIILVTPTIVSRRERTKFMMQDSAGSKGGRVEARNEFRNEDPSDSSQGSGHDNDMKIEMDNNSQTPASPQKAKNLEEGKSQNESL